MGALEWQLFLRLEGMVKTYAGITSMTGALEIHIGCQKLVLDPRNSSPPTHKWGHEPVGGS